MAKKQNQNSFNSVTIAEAEELIFRTFKHMDTVLANGGKIKKHANIMMHGSPGLGKSAITKSVADRLGYRLVDIRLSSMEPTDIMGIPYVSNGEMKFSTPEWWPADGEKVIIILDELKNASKPCQTAAYRLILDRTISNEKRLPDTVFIVAAGNNKEDATGAQDMALAAANRFAMHLFIDRNRALDGFLDYAVTAGFSREIVAFLTWKKSAIYSTELDSSQPSYATPRTWEDVNELLKIGLPDDMLSIAVCGAIGSEHGIGFMGFREASAGLPQWEPIKKGDTSYKFTIKTGEDADRVKYNIAVQMAMEILDIHHADDLTDTDKDMQIERLVDVVLNQLTQEYVTVFFKTMQRDIPAMTALSYNKSLQPKWTETRKAMRGQK